MKKIKFLVAIHCHQPVGNFDNVFEEAFKRAYLPFIQVLQRHPKIKISLHYSGSLIDWLEKSQVDFLRQVAKLVHRGQIEMLSGGYYEPILSLIPAEDGISQIRLLNKKIKKIFGCQPMGAWLTERVWEPHLVRVFTQAGIKYILVDDTHFKMTGKAPEEVWGYYVTEEEGSSLFVFPGSKFLRYALPFKLPEETIGYLKDCLEDKRRAITFADDGEKFGFWPHTYKWVYEEGWLERFFSVIEENSYWIETMHFKDYISLFPPTDRAYLPSASYAEMLEWSGGYFRNFLVKYPEANNMHKKMLELSRRLATFNMEGATPPPKGRLKALLKKAHRHLYMAQDNDAYWHGVFGGLYLLHLRDSVYSNLIYAERLLDEVLHPQENWLGCRVYDFDRDKDAELILENSKLKLYIDLAEEASIFELDYRDKNLNLINTLARRNEKYHKKIKEDFVPDKADEGGAVQSIHDLRKRPREDLSKFLVYDLNRKVCFYEHFLRPPVELEEFCEVRYKKIDNSEQRYSIKQKNLTPNKILIKLKRDFHIDKSPFIINKKIEMEKASSRIRFALELINCGDLPWMGKFGLEFNFSLWDEALTETAEIESLKKLLLKDRCSGVRVEFSLNRESRLWHFPIETVSESESGFERSFQALCLFFNWDLSLEPRESWEVGIIQELQGYGSQKENGGKK